jgi:hypothetical protein
MFTCFIKYVVDLEKREEFEEYASTWMRLIKKYGGIHHGYFLQPSDTDEFPDSSFSFPGIGKNGPDNVAVALFSFPNLEEYETYKRDVKNDKECIAITKRWNKTKCFISYERSFLKPFFPDSK